MDSFGGKHWAYTPQIQFASIASQRCANVRNRAFELRFMDSNARQIRTCLLFDFTYSSP